MKSRMDALLEENTEYSQRVAAEMIAGLVRGAKHWPYDMSKDMWEWMQPSIRKVDTEEEY